MTEKPAAEEYVYHIGKIRFIVTPVYKETGELMRDILLKLICKVLIFRTLISHPYNIFPFLMWLILACVLPEMRPTVNVIS